MSILDQFIESSMGVANEIATLKNENFLLKRRVRELEELKLPKPKPEPEALIEAVSNWSKGYLTSEDLQRDWKKYQLSIE
jgi:hypothetical protein